MAFLNYYCLIAQSRYLVILMSRSLLPKAKPDPTDDLVTKKRLSIPDTRAHVFLLHGARGGLGLSLCCSNTEQDQARFSHTCLWSDTPLTSHSQHLPQCCYFPSSEPCPQSNPGALLSSSPISWRVVFPAGFKGTPGRGAPQSMKRSA